MYICSCAGVFLQCRVYVCDQLLLSSPDHDQLQSTVACTWLAACLPERGSAVAMLAGRPRSQASLPACLVALSISALLPPPTPATHIRVPGNHLQPHSRPPTWSCLPASRSSPLPPQPSACVYAWRSSRTRCLQKLQADCGKTKQNQIACHDCIRAKSKWITGCTVWEEVGKSVAAGADP